MTSVLIPTLKWARLGDFNPLSSKQILAYLKERGYPIPKHRNRRDAVTGQLSDTADEESLLELTRQGKVAHGDLVLDGALFCRHTNKAISYLSDKYLHRDKRLHPIWTVKPKTGRLSCAKPNLQNMPKGEAKKPGAERFQWIMEKASETLLSAVLADPGWTLFEFDWDAIEALLTGYFASDPDYMEAAKKGVHDILSSHLAVRAGLLKEPIATSAPRAEVQTFAKWLKENDKTGIRAKAKKRVYSGSYGQSELSMARDLGISVPAVHELNAVFSEMAPKVVKWQRETLDRAHFDGQLVNPFGMMLDFFDVYSVKGGRVRLDASGRPIKGRQANEALAYLPQSTCGAMAREVLIDLGTRPEEGTEFQLLISEHDSTKGQIREGLEEKWMPLVRASMERAWTELGGLVVTTKAKVGKTMAEMEGWGNG